MLEKTVLPTSVLAPQICRARSFGHSSPPTGVVRTPMDAEARLALFASAPGEVRAQHPRRHSIET